MNRSRAFGGVLLASYVALRLWLESRYELFDPDEGLELLAAGSLRGGKLPYLGALSHRGPFLTVLYGLPCLVFGPFAYRAVHAFAIALFVAVCAWFQGSVARRADERAGLLALANLLMLAVWRVPSEDNWGLNSDFLMAALVMAAMCALLDSLGPHGASPSIAPRLGADASFALAGLLLALATLTKQNAAPCALIPPFFVLFRDRAQAGRKLACWALGLLPPILLTIAVYAAVGQLGRFWYFFYQYNRDYVGAAYAGGGAGTVAALASWLGRSYAELGLLAVVGGIAFAKERSRRLETTFCLGVLWATAGLLAATLPGKDWDNYLWASHAPIALLAALGASALLDHLERRRWSPALERATALAVVGLPVFGCLSMTPRGWAVLRAASEVGGIPPPRVPRRELLALVARLTTESDTIYLTGYAPEMYVLAERRPATRHVISNFVETVYPGRFDTPSTIAPRFFDELRVDLESSRPRVIVDACALGFLCHPSSALTKVLPLLLGDYHPYPEGPTGVFVRNE